MGKAVRATNEKKAAAADLAEKSAKASKSGFLIVGVLCCFSTALVAFCYHRNGPMFFMEDHLKFLDLSAREWQATLKNKTVAFIGGHHRSGTTAIWRAVGKHPEATSFGEQRECGLDFSEGIFAQDVYPHFGMDAVESPLDAMKGLYDKATSSKVEAPKTGLGKYALGPVDEVYWTETHESVGPLAQARLLNAFGFYWNRQKPLEETSLLLEKSPPNAVIARYLQALVDYESPAVTMPKKKDGDDDEFDSCSATGTCHSDLAKSTLAVVPKSSESKARFIFVSRHPIANAMSHQKVNWHLQYPELLAHWLAVATYSHANVGYLAHATTIKMEDFCKQPAEETVKLWDFLGLKGHTLEDARLATADVRPDPNKKYKAEYCKPILAGQAAANDFHLNLADAFGTEIKTKFGYEIKDWCSQEQD